LVSRQASKLSSSVKHNGRPAAEEHSHTEVQEMRVILLVDVATCK
jgi:hypothetical protein